MVRFAPLLAPAFILLSAPASAHPGAHSGAAKTEAQLTSRKLFVENGKRLLEKCSHSEAGRKLQELAATRRHTMLKSIQAQRRLDADTILSTAHEDNRTGLSTATNASELFGSEPACLLEPEVTEGPYYVDGELIRSDIRETQPGIDLYMDLQFIDVNTCTPVDQLYVDFWHANLTGVYSGVVARTNGNSDDATNSDTTFHRGLYPTDADGFVSFTTKFPGLYTGRTAHIHIMTHYDGTVVDNRYSGGKVSHVGQLFFDQSLINEVQSTSAYSVNTNAITTNEEDSILMQSAADDFDPFVEYVLLGDTVEAGLLSWISVGVDMTSDYSVSAVATYTGDSSVAASAGGDTGASLRFQQPTPSLPCPEPSRCLSNLFATAAAATFALAGISSAHPGAHEASKTETQFAARKLSVDESRRLLENCVNSENGRNLQEKAVARRLAKIETIQAQRRRLDLATALSTDHKSNLTGLAATTVASELFGSEPACVLEPEVTEGPYYAKGELIRSDIRETQPGIDLYMDLQFIDVNTCTPVDQLYVDFWHANLTGVYSGVVASGNGNSNDATNINATFLRGLYPTDADGFVSFTTKFPGHYTGRTTHVHIMSHHNGTLLANNTYSGGKVSHVGQLFFDQSLITEVQATSAYAVNTNTITTNADDNIAAQAATDGFDPFVKYVLLGANVENGLLGWISVGVNMTQAYSVSAAVTMTANGGVASTSTTTGGGPNGGTPPPGGNMTGTTSPSASSGSTAGSAGTTVSANVSNAGETLRSSLIHVGGMLLSMAYLLF